MNKKTLEYFSEEPEKALHRIDLVPVILVFLIPIIVGLVFFRVRYMGGAPVWIYWILGILFLLGLIQVVFYVIAILKYIICKNKDKNRKGSCS